MKPATRRLMLAENIVAARARVRTTISDAEASIILLDMQTELDHNIERAGAFGFTETETGLLLCLRDAVRAYREGRTEDLSPAGWSAFRRIVDGPEGIFDRLRRPPATPLGDPPPHQLGPNPEEVAA